MLLRAANAELTGPGVAATTKPKSTQNRRGDTGVRLSVVLDGAAIAADEKPQ
jgi:hypothetical protein